MLPLTPRRIGIRFVKLERHTANKVAEVIGTPNDVRILCRRSAANGNGPTMGVFVRGVGLTFFGGQNDGSVPINDRSVDSKALGNGRRSERRVVWRKVSHTFTRMRSVDITKAS